VSNIFLVLKRVFVLDEKELEDNPENVHVVHVVSSEEGSCILTHSSVVFHVHISIFYVYICACTLILS